MTQNCVITCEKSISMPVTPETKQRSNIPSFLSINMAPDVRATDKKKTILKKGTDTKKQVFSFDLLKMEKEEIFGEVLVKIIK